MACILPPETQLACFCFWHISDTFLGCFETFCDILEMFLSNFSDIAETYVMPCILPPETRLAPVSPELQWRLGGNLLTICRKWKWEKVKLETSWGRWQNGGLRCFCGWLVAISRVELEYFSNNNLPRHVGVCRTKYVWQSKFDYNWRARRVIKTFQSCLLFLHFCKLVLF